jgi:hypothetical protein
MIRAQTLKEWLSKRSTRLGNRSSLITSLKRFEQRLTSADSRLRLDLEIALSGVPAPNSEGFRERALSGLKDRVT